MEENKTNESNSSDTSNNATTNISNIQWNSLKREPPEKPDTRPEHEGTD